MGEKTRLQMLMRPRPRHQNRRQLRHITLVAGVLLALYCLVFVWRPPASPSSSSSSSSGSYRDRESYKLNGSRAGRARKQQPSTQPPRPPREILNNLSLDEEQCNAYFPGLTKQIEDVVAQGPFEVKQTGDSGPLQGRIKDGQVRDAFFLYCLLFCCQMLWEA